MRAAILAVGSELLGTERLDTNSLKLTAALRRHGVVLVAKAVVGDLEEEIAAALGSLAARADLVLISGGLGPTADDVTREAVARALGRELAVDEEVLAGIAARFARYGLRMPEVNRREARVLAGSTLLANRFGSAPGMLIEAEGRAVFLFPGVPRELEGMVGAHLEPWLAARGNGTEVESLTLKVACLPESHVEERIAPAYGEFGREDITLLSAPGEVRVVLSACGEVAARAARLAAMAARMRELLGEALFAAGEGMTLEGVVVDRLRAGGLRLATAESCTGGLLAERLTRVAGASEVFTGGVVAYSNRLKEELLGVPAALLEAHGAVSDEVAAAMAAGCRRRLGADLAAAITGIAGPGGGSEDKPVGTVHLAVAGAGDAIVVRRRLRLPGERERVRGLASQFALDALRRHLGGHPPLGAGG